MIYYKGNVVSTGDITGYYKIGKNIYSQKYSDFNSEFVNRCNPIDFITFKNFLIKLGKVYDGYSKVIIDDPILINIFIRTKIFIDADNLFEYSRFDDFNDIDGYEIIYTKVVDSEGRVFAREIKTGVIFPLFNDSSFKTNYYLITFDNNECSLRMEVGINDEFIKRADHIVVEDKVANKNEVEEYLDGFYSEYGHDLDEETIIYDADSNVFAGPIVEKEEKDYSLNPENNYTGQIRYYLSCLKNISPQEYEQFNNDFEYLVNSYEEKDLNIPITLGDLESMLSRIKFACLFNKNNDRGISTSVIKVYEDSINRIKGLDSKFKEFSISKLDSLYELFISNSGTMNLKDQDEVLKNFAYAYVLKIKEFGLNESDLASTHFNDLKYYAMTISNDRTLVNLVGNDVIDIVNRIGYRDDALSLVKHI